jgi:hypothetical protein
MVVSLNLEQTVLWLHPTEAQPAFLRVEINELRLDVAKTLALCTHVSVEVGSLIRVIASLIRMIASLIR